MLVTAVRRTTLPPTYSPALWTISAKAPTS